MQFRGSRFVLGRGGGGIGNSAAAADAATIAHKRAGTIRV